MEDVLRYGDDDLTFLQKLFVCSLCLNCFCSDEDIDRTFGSTSDSTETSKISKKGMNCCKKFGLVVGTIVFGPVLVPLAIFYFTMRLLNYLCCGGFCSHINVFCKDGVWHCGGLSSCKSPCPCDCCLDPGVTIQLTEKNASHHSDDTTEPQ